MGDPIVDTEKVRLRKAVNIDGLEWPAGEYEVQDPYWARRLEEVMQAEMASGAGDVAAGESEAEDADRLHRRRRRAASGA
jgi:hypothetical protein